MALTSEFCLIGTASTSALRWKELEPHIIRSLSISKISGLLDLTGHVKKDDIISAGAFYETFAAKLIISDPLLSVCMEPPPLAVKVMTIVDDEEIISKRRKVNRSIYGI